MHMSIPYRESKLYLASVIVWTFELHRSIRMMEVRTLGVGKAARHELYAVPYETDIFL